LGANGVVANRSAIIENDVFGYRDNADCSRRIT